MRGREPYRVFIGYDPMESLAAEVAKESLLSTGTHPIAVTMLNQEKLRLAGLYGRTAFQQDTQCYDATDMRPFSTEFSFTRFLVPALCQWEGWALFVDGDVLFRGAIEELFTHHNNAAYAVQCVKHDYTESGTKMRGGVIQEAYPKKNWSSVMLFNCSHPSCYALTPFTITNAYGTYLQQFRWCTEDQVGALPAKWNWLEGHHTQGQIDPIVVHYTRGTPNVPGYENSPFADEWRAYAQTIN